MDGTHTPRTGPPTTTTTQLGTDCRAVSAATPTADPADLGVQRLTQPYEGYTAAMQAQPGPRAPAASSPALLPAEPDTATGLTSRASGP